MDASTLVENLAESLRSVTESAPLSAQEKKQFNQALAGVDPKLRPTLSQHYKVKKCFLREELEQSFNGCSPFANKSFIDPFRWVSCLRAIATGSEDVEKDPPSEKKGADADGEKPNTEEDNQNILLKQYPEYLNPKD